MVMFRADKSKLTPAVNVAEAANTTSRGTDHCRIVNTQKNTAHFPRAVPIVEMNVELKASSENLNRTQVFPTPESPINSNLNK